MFLLHRGAVVALLGIVLVHASLLHELPLQEDAVAWRQLFDASQLPRPLSSLRSSKTSKPQPLKESFESGGNAKADQIREFVSSVMECMRLPGLVLGVVQDGELVIQDGFGFADWEKKTPVTNDTLFGIGSTSKAFTSMLVAQLVAEGRVAYEHLMSDYLPEFRIRTNDANDILTVRDMLSHRTGLPRHDSALFTQPLNRSRGDVVMNARYLEPSYTIRQKWQYNNYMITAVGYMVARLQDTVWEDLVVENVFKPLDMHNTYSSFARAENAPNRAIPATCNANRSQCSNNDWALNKFIDIAAPAGAIVSNVKDMMKWLRVHLDHGLGAESSADPGPDLAKLNVTLPLLREMHSMRTLIDYEVFLGQPGITQDLLDLYSWLLGEAYGYCWFNGRYRGHRRVFHGGDVFGMHSLISLIPDQRLGIFMSTNANNPSSFWREVIAARITDIMLGLEPVVNSTEAACAFPCKTFPDIPSLCHQGEQRASTPSPPSKPAPPSQNPAVPRNITEYVGVYHHPTYGTVTTTAVPGQPSSLHVNLNGVSIGQFLATFQHGDTFSATPLGVGGNIVFWRNYNGVVVAAVARYKADVFYSTVFTNQDYNPAVDSLGCPFSAHTEAVIVTDAGPRGVAGSNGRAGSDGSSGGLSTGGVVGVAIAVGVISSVVVAFAARRFSGGRDQSSYITM